MLLRWIRRPIKEGTQTRGMAGILSFFPAEVMLYSPQMRPIATAVARFVVGMLFDGTPVSGTERPNRCNCRLWD